VLDIHHQCQSGLTMRTFEVLAMGKKLITTNALVQAEPFFDDRWVLVVDRGDPVIPKDFLITDPPPLWSGFVDRYSIKGWLRDVLSIPNAASDFVP
jgi:hypothetical protein